MFARTRGRMRSCSWSSRPRISRSSTWLTNAEDNARADAAQLAEEVAEGVPGEGVETRVRDADPVKAVEDALSDFPAAELIVITRAGEEADWLEEETGPAAQNRFSLPVTHIVVAE